MPSREERVGAAQRIGQFMADDAVSDVLSKLERKYYEEFKSATGNEQRTQAWAKAKVLDDFVTGLRGKMDDGRLAQHEIVRDARNEALRRQGKPLPGE